MKKVILGLTMALSASVFGNGTHSSVGNTICGVEGVPASEVYNALEEARVVEAIQSMEVEVVKTAVCKYKEGVAVVGTFQNGRSYALYFKN